jgi:hypothetical protein
MKKDLNILKCLNYKMDSCPVCLEVYTTSVRRAISCPHCTNSACVKCHQTYLLQSAKDPHCLQCMKLWNRTFLQEHFSKSFINDDYAKRRAEILWSREESFIPELQTKALNIKKSEEFEEHEIKPLIEVSGKLFLKKREIEETLRNIQNEIWNKTNERDRIKLGLDSKDELTNEKERMKFKRKCTVPDCPGWLSSAWKCGLCENFTCPDCYAIKGKEKNCEHTCKPEDVETVKLLKENVKPCPKCGEGVEKNGGCNVMFCTSCHTGFEWTNGKILQNAQIHNPHYFEWLAQNGDNQQQNEGAEGPCAGRIGPHLINRVGTSYRGIFGKIVRTIMHVEDIEYNRYSFHLNNQNNEDLMIEYLLKRKAKEDIKRTIQNRERRVEREKSIRDALETFVLVGSEQVRSIVASPDTIVKGMEDLDKLRGFVNETLTNIGKLYGCKVPWFDGWEKITTVDPPKKSRKDHSVITEDSETI